ncbi:hypothetical protein R6U77_00080 [Lysinibacillus louembei]|uniref:AMP-activated protein kinase glycogen-binding domain-containing protein n=1 Tax=Lysinibacillus louembei TaxID=1470088 RepID=A0ABZ0RVE2_9BACI|nr:hypothetical protein [Lysinibacillus louembei]WPK12120.1 hypothetical protein R6U77_00080 [Lysinibacillus louembei]
MNVLLKYEESPYLPIHSLAVIGDFNDLDATKGVMQKQGNEWYFETHLISGQYRYKFLINDKLLLNDPYANMYEVDDKEEIWSMLLINHQQERMYDSTEYTIHIHDYGLTEQVLETEQPFYKKVFSMDMDSLVVAQFEFRRVTGAHPVTIIWYAPNKEIMQVSEHLLFTEMENEPVRMWFWLDLHQEDKQKMLGNWKIQLLIDGEYILEDTFAIHHTGFFTSAGQSLEI